jgi:nucleoside 2-deoxyribosyltransferase
MIQPPTIYLAGPINGKTDAECKDWREQFKALKQFRFLDPMDRDYRGKEMGNAEVIVYGDLKDIQQSDVIVANTTSPSWGTAMELVYAFGMGVPILAIHPDPLHASPWLVFHATQIFRTTQQVMDYLKEHINEFKRSE